MRALGIDPGAVRLGYAVVDRNGDSYSLIKSGIVSVPRRDDELFQAYRLRVIRHWVDTEYRMAWSDDDSFCGFLDWPELDLIVSEILPGVGGGNFVGSVEVAKAAMTALQAVHWIQRQEVEWQQVGASTVKKNVVGTAKKATKVQVRNAVQEVFPELKERKWEVDLYADETDAIAVALTGLGYKKSNGKKNKN